MPTLEVPNAELYYETVGSGPMLLCISGADGSCDIWRQFAEKLKDHFQVVMWDRRGFSRSQLTGPQDYSKRLETDADDAALLIKHVSPGAPATVIGNSSGGVVSLRLLTRHPDLIRTLIPYEPPTASILPDLGEIWATHEKIYALWREQGPLPPLSEFAKMTHMDERMIQGGLLLQAKHNPFMWGNLQYWFEREFMVYPKAELDVEGGLQPLKEKLLFVNGESSPQEAYQCRGNVVLAEKLDLSVQYLPGEHVAHATHPKEFSAAILEALKAKDGFYASL